MIVENNRVKRERQRVRCFGVREKMKIIVGVTRDGRPSLKRTEI
jgi:hypothetical protein